MHLNLILQRKVVGYDSKYAYPFVPQMYQLDLCFIQKKVIWFLEFDTEAICRRMVLVCGTSTCHMAISRDKLFIPGVWGPFWSGMSQHCIVYYLSFNMILPCVQIIISSRCRYSISQPWYQNIGLQKVDRVLLVRC